MIQFKVSTPCCLSLFGEYSAKYGRKNLVAAIDSRTTLTFKELPPSEHSSLHLNFHGNKLVQESLEKFLKFYSDCKENMMKENMTSFRERVLQFTGDSYKSDNHKMIVQAFYYLLVLMAFKKKIDIKSFTMDLSTELMMDDELACPASYTVCLAASLLHWSRLQKGIYDTFDKNDIQKILEYATRCEEIFSESELMNVTACTYGLIMKKNMVEINTIDVLPYKIPMPILLVDSKQTQNLEAQMQERIAEFNTSSHRVVSSLFNCIDILTNCAYNTFRNLIDILKDKNIDIETRRTRILQKHNELKFCIRTNQNLLHSLNVSHYHLDEICLIAQKHGMYGKYTDIGSGRYAYIWCPRHVDEPCTHMMLISEELKLHGFDVTETNLAQSGMRIEMLLNSQV